MGNEFRENPDGSRLVIANQEINPNVLSAADNHTGTFGSLTLHETTEAYEGAKISLQKGRPSPNSSIEGSVYQEAHNKAFPQTPINEMLYNKNGNVTKSYSEAVKAEYYVENFMNKRKVIQFYEEDKNK